MAHEAGNTSAYYSINTRFVSRKEAVQVFPVMVFPYIFAVYNTSKKFSATGKSFFLYKFKSLPAFSKIQSNPIKIKIKNIIVTITDISKISLQENFLVSCLAERIPLYISSKSKISDLF